MDNHIYVTWLMQQCRGQDPQNVNGDDEIGFKLKKFITEILELLL
jgi:hypothetical protein